MAVRALNPSRLASLRKGRSRDDVAFELRKRGFKANAQQIKRWETGENVPRASVIPALADVYGVSIDQLYGEPDEEDEHSMLRTLADAAAERGDFDTAQRVYGLLKQRAAAAGRRAVIEEAREGAKA